jgi:hypothetical protein
MRKDQMLEYYVNNGSSEVSLELTGSEKQIEWANKIRADAIRKLDTNVSLYTDEQIKIITSRLNALTDAKFIIENRSDLTFYRCVLQENER